MGRSVGMGVYLDSRKATPVHSLHAHLPRIAD
jgi:hypothetical protein